MTKMVRTQVFITTKQKEGVKKRAALAGVSEAEIIRRGIDRELEQAIPVAEGDWKDAWRQACGMWKDRDDIEEFYAERRRRRRRRRHTIQS